MAGDWIKIEHALPEKPEVQQIAAALRLDRYAVAGRLVRIWSWADEHSLDGNAVPVTGTFLDELCHCQGFAKAMRDAHWLEGRDGALIFPRFDRHNGQTAKARSQTNRRVASHRERRSNADVTEPPLQKPLPEKRRKEKKEDTPPTPSAQAPAEKGVCVLSASLQGEGFPEAWAEWETYRTELGKPLTTGAREILLAKCETWGAKRSVGIIRLAVEKGWFNLLAEDERAYAVKAPVPPAKPKPPEAPEPWLEDFRFVEGALRSNTSLNGSFKEVLAKARALPNAVWGMFSIDDRNTLHRMLKAHPEKKP